MERATVNVDGLGVMMSRHASDFLADVITNRKAWRGGDGSVLGRNGSGFASLWPENKGYNEYKAFEERLEGFIRDSLVNPILEDLFRAAGMGFDLCKPEEKLAFASNRFYEEYCECEFIVGTADSKVGYRYTHPSPAWVDIQGFIEREKLDCVVVIDWSDMGESEPKKVETTPENRLYFEKVYELSAGSFLAGHFPKEVRESFTVKVGDAIAKANELLGFRTIRSPSPSNMPGIKRRVLDSLREYEGKPKRYRQAANAQPFPNDLNDDDTERLDKEFFEGGLYQALCGEEDFAKSFVTAEYLFETFCGNDDFDYSAIVIDYVKSVEQLERLLVLRTLDMPHHYNLWIKKGGGVSPKQKGEKSRLSDEDKKSMCPWPHKQDKTQHVRFARGNEDHFDMTLVSMANLLHDNRKNWESRGISDEGRHFFINKLREYARLDRNGFVHKDNMGSWDEVKRIRDNTYLMLYMLLGGYEIAETKRGQYELLGVDSALYAELCASLYGIPRSLYRYILEFEGAPPINAIRLYDLETAEEASDPLGQSHQRLLFVEVDDFDMGVDQHFFDTVRREDVLEIAPANIPTRVHLIVYGDDRKTLWQ